MRPRVTNKVVGGLTFVRLHRYIPIHLLLGLLDVLMFTFLPRDAAMLERSWES